jgi:hypothetical protein
MVLMPLTKVGRGIIGNGYAFPYVYKETRIGSRISFLIHIRKLIFLCHFS